MGCGWMLVLDCWYGFVGCLEHVLVFCLFSFGFVCSKGLLVMVMGSIGFVMIMLLGLW